MSAARRTLVTAVLLGLGLTLTQTAAETDAAVPSGVQAVVEQYDGWKRTTVMVPGTLVSYALPRSGSGTREIALLVAPRADRPDMEALTDDEGSDDGPLRLPDCPVDEAESNLALLRLSAGDDSPPRSIREGLPHDLEALDAADLDGNGAEELLLARKGELLVVAPDGQRSLVADPGLLWASLHPRATEQPEMDGQAWVTTMPLGELLVFGAGATGGSWQRRGEVELPLKANVRRQSLHVFNPIPRFVGMREDGTLLFTTRPEAYGNQRLHTLLITVAPSGETEVTDCWVRLPTPEDVLEVEFPIIDDQAMLLVTTKPANKLSLFGEKRLRLFQLQRDRSRLGKPPVYLAESRMNMWQEAAPILLDVNSDGRQDLVIGYWKGLSDDRVVLDVYLRETEGWFATTPETTSFNVKPAKRREEPDSKPTKPSPDRSFVRYGHDLDGDSLPDLLLRTHVSLLIFRGKASKDGGALLEKEPLELPLTGGSGEIEYYVSFGPGNFDSGSLGGPDLPRLADLDGDGDAEILTVTRGADDAPDLLQVIDLER